MDLKTFLQSKSEVEELIENEDGTLSIIVEGYEIQIALDGNIIKIEKALPKPTARYEIYKGSTKLELVDGSYPKQAANTPIKIKVIAETTDEKGVKGIYAPGQTEITLGNTIEFEINQNDIYHFTLEGNNGRKVDYPVTINFITIDFKVNFIEENGYMLLHADPEKRIDRPYKKVTIEFTGAEFAKKMYHIIGDYGDEGWKEYTGEPIKVNVRNRMEAKAIDKTGVETSLGYYTASEITDALDMSSTTGKQVDEGYKFIDVDPSMIGKKMIVSYDFRRDWDWLFRNESGGTARYYSMKNNLTQQEVEVPAGAVRVALYYSSASSIGPGTIKQIKIVE